MFPSRCVISVKNTIKMGIIYIVYYIIKYRNISHEKENADAKTVLNSGIFFTIDMFVIYMLWIKPDNDNHDFRDTILDIATLIPLAVVLAAIALPIGYFIMWFSTKATEACLALRRTKNAIKYEREKKERRIIAKEIEKARIQGKAEGKAERDALWIEWDKKGSPPDKRPDKLPDNK